LAFLALGKKSSALLWLPQLYQPQTKQLSGNAQNHLTILQQNSKYIIQFTKGREGEESPTQTNTLEKIAHAS